MVDGGTQGIYLVTDGRPNQPVETLISQMRFHYARIPVHCISFNCQDAKANQFLLQLAKETNGRFHYFNEAEAGQMPSSEWESEDLHLLRREHQFGMDSIDRLGLLVEECSRLAWSGVRHSSFTKTQQQNRELTKCHHQRQPKSQSALSCHHRTSTLIPSEWLSYPVPFEPSAYHLNVESGWDNRSCRVSSFKSLETTTSNDELLEHKEASLLEKSNSLRGVKGTNGRGIEEESMANWTASEKYVCSNGPEETVSEVAEPRKSDPYIRAVSSTFHRSTSPASGFELPIPIPPERTSSETVRQREEYDCAPSTSQKDRPECMSRELCKSAIIDDTGMI
ncbi:unnamed protein product [Protopolystoma xenopodis]|uniref:VWFA domain-containing protein n=1 Tax=Protopolystoma xenopodis TaxID=117903 RepID=A0A3S5AIJ8_9PLAT|nr:unnamed protein product [Protopolystoma xenopodis]